MNKTVLAKSAFAGQQNFSKLSGSIQPWFINFHDSVGRLAGSPAAPWLDRELVLGWKLGGAAGSEMASL